MKKNQNILIHQKDLYSKNQGYFKMNHLLSKKNKIRALIQLNYLKKLLSKSLKNFGKKQSQFFLSNFLLMDFD